MEYILPVRFDDTPVFWLPSALVYLRYESHGAQGVAQLLQKLGRGEGWYRTQGPPRCRVSSPKFESLGCSGTSCVAGACLISTAQSGCWGDWSEPSSSTSLNCPITMPQPRKHWCSLPSISLPRPRRCPRPRPRPTGTDHGRAVF